MRNRKTNLQCTIQGILFKLTRCPPYLQNGAKEFWTLIIYESSSLGRTRKERKRERKRKSFWSWI